MNTNQFSTIEEALEDFKKGKPLIVADDEDSILKISIITIVGKSPGNVICHS